MCSCAAPLQRSSVRSQHQCASLPVIQGQLVGGTAVPHRRERLLRDCDDFPQSFPHRSSVRSVRWMQNARAENYRLWPNELSLPGPMWARRGEKVTEPFLLQLNVINQCLSNEIGGEALFSGFFASSPLLWELI